MNGSKFSPVTEGPKDESANEEPSHVHGLRGLLQVRPTTDQVELRQTHADVRLGAAEGKPFIISPTHYQFLRAEAHSSQTVGAKAPQETRVISGTARWFKYVGKAQYSPSVCYHMICSLCIVQFQHEITPHSFRDVIRGLTKVRKLILEKGYTPYC